MYVLVIPAQAGMILLNKIVETHPIGYPCTSGDDPVFIVACD